MKKIGLDVGSTTIKCVVLDDNNEIIYSNYERHMSRIVEMTSYTFVQNRRNVSK